VASVRGSGRCRRPLGARDKGGVEQLRQLCVLHLFFVELVVRALYVAKESVRDCSEIEAAFSLPRVASVNLMKGSLRFKDAWSLHKPGFDGRSNDTW
jgi:hypothetical protein